MMQDQSRNRTPMPAAQPPADTARPEPGPARAEAGIARMLAASADTAVSRPDPILAAIEAWRVRNDALDAFDAQVRAGSFVGNKIAEERHLVAELTPERDAVLATVPTTPAGRAALVRFVRDEIDASGMADGGPPDDDHPIWRDGLRALLAAQEMELRAGSAAPHADLGRASRRQEVSLDLVVMVDRWQALLDRINGEGIADAEVERLGLAHDDLQRAIYDFPAASIADLLTKVPVFRDELYDAIGGLDDRFGAEDTLSGAAWLGLFRDFERLARIASSPLAPASTAQTATGPGADAALVALVTRFEAADRARDAADAALDRVYAAIEPTEPTPPDALRRAGDSRHFFGGAANPESPEFYAAEEVYRLRAVTCFGHAQQRDTDAALARVAEISAAWDEWLAACDANFAAHGLQEAEARWEAANAELLALKSEIQTLRPVTLAGLAAKARVWNDTGNTGFAAAIRADLIAMAELEGRPQIEPSLSDEIVACWRKWAALPDFDKTEQGRADFERRSAERSALCAAAEALPVALGNVPAKALALAWLGYVDLWQHGADREAYGLDGRLALDIDTAITGRLKTHYSGEVA